MFIRITVYQQYRCQFVPIEHTQNAGTDYSKKSSLENMITVALLDNVKEV